MRAIVVHGDARARRGIDALKALWRDSERHYFVYELSQFLFFQLSATLFPRRCLNVAGLARKLGIPTLSVRRVNGARARAFAETFQPDLLVSVKCPQRIREPLLSLARMGSINLHASLLPRFAGRAPHFWAMSEGATQAGTSVHAMTENFDEGNILVQKRLEIPSGSTAFGLLMALMRLGGDALVEAVPRALEGAEGKSQSLENRSYHSHPTPEAYRALREHGFRLWRPSELIKALREART